MLNEIPTPNNETISREEKTGDYAKLSGDNTDEVILGTPVVEQLKDVAKGAYVKGVAITVLALNQLKACVVEPQKNEPGPDEALIIASEQQEKKSRSCEVSTCCQLASVCLLCQGVNAGFVLGGLAAASQPVTICTFGQAWIGLNVVEGLATSACISG